MLTRILGELLPVAVAVALSPIPIIAIVVVLGSERARANGAAFAAGWVIGLGALASAVFALAPGDPTDPPLWLSLGRIALGLACLGLAARRWRGRPRAGEPSEMPGWMATLDRVHPRRAFGLGVTLAAANPKNLALTVKAASAVAGLALAPGDRRLAVAVYVVLGSVTVVGAVLAHALGGRRAEAGLASLKGFMVANNDVIVMVILLLIGASILGDGIAGVR